MLRLSQGRLGEWLSQGIDLEVSHGCVDLVGKGRHLVALRLLGMETSHHLLALTVLMST